MTREYDPQSEDKNESELSNLDIQLSAEAVSKIEELNILYEKQQSLHGKRKALILKLLETLREDGFKDHQIVDIVFSRVKGVSRSTIYAALPPEVKREYTKKSLPDNISITTKHKVIDPEEGFKVPSNVPETTPETIITKSEGEIAEAEYKKETQPEGFPFSNENRDRQLTLDEIFKFLPNDNGMTSWKAESVSGKALKNRITSWQGNSDKFFRVWLQEITK